MKKNVIRLLAVLLVLVLDCSLLACSSDNQITDNQTTDNQITDNTTNSNNSTNETNEEEKLNNAEIEYATTCSEDLMFVKLVDNDEKIFCVDKKGTIVFELDDEIVNVYPADSKFMGNYAFVSAKDEMGEYHTALCDKEGKLIYPSDVGATEFYGPDEILKSGYVLATKIDADYSGTKSQLGVLDSSFEWVVPLSEPLYEEFADSLRDSYNENFIIDDSFYSVKLAKSLNLKTGEVKSVNLKDVTPSSGWGVPGSREGYYRVESNMIVFEDGMYINMVDKNVAAASDFTNGTAGIVYHNEEAGKYFITMIDENGSHFYEPIEIQLSSMTFQFVTDGENLVSLEKGIIVCRNNKGEKLGEFDTQSFDCEKITINSGVITINGEEKGKDRAICFDLQLNQLF